MLLIFCGEDVVTSRKKCITYIQQKKEEGCDLHLLNSSNLISQLSQLNDALGLFYDKEIIWAEECLKDKKNRDYLKSYQDATVEIVLFESNLQEKELKFTLPKAKYINSKVSSSIFGLLDNLVPGNLNNSILQLSEVVNFDNELLILYMIKNRIKSLLLVKDNMTENMKLQGWQLVKLKHQASCWDKSKLLGCYENIFKIEKNFKTSSQVFTIPRSLEMLFCFYL